MAEKHDEPPEEQPTARPIEDFRAINEAFQSRTKITHETIGRAWLVYMEHHRDPISKRRREILGSIIDLIPQWRELASSAEVVLGKGDMVEHEPLYRLINSVNWPNPDPVSYTMITNELTRLMDMVEKLIDDDTRLSARDASRMQLELLHHGLLPAKVDEDVKYSEEEAAAMDLDPSHPGIMYESGNSRDGAVHPLDMFPPEQQSSGSDEDDIKWEVLNKKARAEEK